MSNLINLTFETANPIRIIDQNGDFWFVANDVCNILEIQNTTQALQSLDDDEKAKIDTTSSPMFNIGVHKGVKEINIINESGLYTLILRSRKAMQKGTVQHKFRKWVTAEVLPTLRKTGSYHTPEPATPTPQPESPKLSPSDYDIVRRAVQHISIGMYFPGVSASAIHARLRHLCGVDSVCELRYEHLPLIQNELYRIERTLAPYKKMRLETEKQLIRRVCGDDEFAVSAAILDIEKTATAYAKAGDRCLSATLQIKRIAQIGGAM